MDISHEAAAMVSDLVTGIQQALGENLVGLYLRGSLAMGDFDPATSDVDFLAVTERPISEQDHKALAVLHKRLAKLPNKYANDIEGAYIERDAIKRYQSGRQHLTISRGGALGWSVHGENWLLERWMVREQGAVLFGPDPSTFIDPISAEQIVAAVRNRLKDWVDWANDLDDPEWLLPRRSHKAYVVETMCRALYTLETGRITTKPHAVAWALETLPQPWRDLVERSQAWRTDSTIDLSIVPEVRSFVLWVGTNDE